MVKHKQIVCVLLFTISPILAIAQTLNIGSSSVNSPYTRYGYGELSGQGLVNTKGMGGIAYGLRDKYHINPVNPASYTAVDSLTFLFDAGITLQNTNFSDGTTKINARNSSFDYATMQFRLRRGMGMTLGVLPFSNVGYNISQVNSSTEGSSQINKEEYVGDGGLHQVFLGLGVNVLKNLSVGANVSYLWGDINKYRQLSFPADNDIFAFQETTNLSVADFKLDFGVQYTHNINKRNKVILGAVFAPGRNLNNDASIQTVMVTGSDGNTSATVGSVTQRDTIAEFKIPASFGVGLTYILDNRLTVGLDYTFQKWASASYMDNSNAFCDRSKIAVGVEYLPNEIGRSFFSHIKYRVGAYYSLPYYKAEENGEAFRAAKEFGLTAGLTLPVPRSLSKLSLSAQYVKVTGQRSNMLDEKYLRFSIGLTFNERWFFKRKVN